MIVWSSAIKKEGNADTCYNMDGPRRHYPITKGQILCVPTNTGYLEYVPVSKKERAGARAGGEEGELEV